MTSINPINVNTTGVGAKVGFGAQPKAEKEETKTAAEQHSAEKAQVSPDKVFDYMAANSASVVPKKSIDPAKYVDEASAKRIASFMGSFEDKVAEGLKAFDKEFQGVNISDSAKMAVVLKQVDNENV